MNIKIKNLFFSLTKSRPDNTLCTYLPQYFCTHLKYILRQSLYIFQSSVPLTTRCYLSGRGYKSRLGKVTQWGTSSIWTQVSGWMLLKIWVGIEPLVLSDERLMFNTKVNRSCVQFRTNKLFKILKFQAIQWGVLSKLTK